MSTVVWRLLVVLAALGLSWVAWAQDNRTALMWGLISATAMTLGALLQATERAEAPR